MNQSTTNEEHELLIFRIHAQEEHQTTYKNGFPFEVTKPKKMKRRL
jgi:hypothetical protein